ncbi:MAG: kelch repeat-containing protein, partial [bacterium]
MNRFGFALLTVIIVAASAALAVDWMPLAPTPRCAAKAAFDSTNNRAVLFGGTTVYADNRYLGDVWALDWSNVGPRGWRPLTPSGTPPSGRADHLFVHDPDGQRMLLFAGSPSRYAVTNDIWALNLAPGAESWQQLAPSGSPSARAYPMGIYHPTRRSLIVYGGWSGSTELGDVWELKLDSLVWRQLSPSGTPPSARYDAACCLGRAENRLVIFGGRNGGQFLNDLWALDLTPGSEQWTQLSANGQVPDGRCGAAYAASSSGSELYVFAGWDTYEFFNDLYRLDVGTLTWTRLNPGGVQPPPRRNTCGFAGPDGLFCVFGGEAWGGGVYVCDTYIADCRSTGVAWQSPAEFAANPNLRISVQNGVARIHWNPARPGRATVTVLDVTGRIIARLYEGAAPGGPALLEWTGTDGTGRAVPA